MKFIVRSLTSLLLGLLLSGGCSGPPAKRSDFKVVVLGFDGVDPDLVRQWIDKLPNIERLSASGTLTDLGTTNPPESPVAWASFSTGMNPGKHGIFDFLRRDPATYFPDIGLVEVEKAKFLLDILPIRGARVTNNRKGISFWKHLDLHGVATTNLRMPLEFPAEELEVGKTWSGLGVPDIRGTWGTYFYFATDLTQWDLSDTEFGGRMVRLEFKTDRQLTGRIDGPVDPRSQQFERIEIPLQLELNEEGTTVKIVLQGQEQTVAEKAWSDWFRFEFPIGPFVSARGVSRFYVLETFPEVRLYLMPISLDPISPPIAISAPADFTGSLAENQGTFKTLGWIHETWGLNEEQIDEGIFLEDLFRNMASLEKALLDALDRGDASVYSAVFTATDSVSHMFFRLMDPQHPRYDAELAKKYGDAILRVYQRMDEILGNVEGKLGGKDILIVVSDHGFHSWRKEFNTNTWLVRNGYMALVGDGGGDTKKLDDMFSGGSFFPNVDWSRTRAYSLGLGHIYVNLKGREAKGVVEPGAEYSALVRRICDEILQFGDPDTAEPVLQGAYLRDDIYSGAELDHAGDIQLTFRSGYRTSWQTSLGAIPEHLVVANMKKWSGDHCASDPSDTPGFLLTNRLVTAQDPNIIDIAPTLYGLFGVPVPAEVDGKSLGLE